VLDIPAVADAVVYADPDGDDDVHSDDDDVAVVVDAVAIPLDPRDPSKLFRPFRESISDALEQSHNLIKLLLHSNVRPHYIRNQLQRA